MKIFFSDPSTGPDRLAASAGKPHYSYAFPCQRIMSLFSRAMPRHLPRPEIVSSDIARGLLGLSQDERSAHLIFRPFDQIRPLKGAYNIAHVPWEFNHLVDEPPVAYPHPFLSQRKMLQTCDEIWTGSRHAVEVYRAHGIKNVCLVPSPVPCVDGPRAVAERASVFSRFSLLPSVTLGISFGINNVDRLERNVRPLGEQPALSDLSGRRIYLTVFNPGDFRKNAELLLRGFAAFASRHPEAVLLVKLVIDNVKPTLVTAQQNTLLPKFLEHTTLHSGNVVFISPFLDEAAMGALYRVADYYVCLSIGEGQNLPLCEAMAQGVIPVSVAHTAMADYIDDEVGVVVPSRLNRVLQPEASHYTMDGFVEGYTCDEADYVVALEQSFALDAHAQDELSKAAWRRARERFSSDAIRDAIITQSACDFGGTLQ